MCHESESSLFFLQNKVHDERDDMLVCVNHSSKYIYQASKMMPSLYSTHIHVCKYVYLYVCVFAYFLFVKYWYFTEADVLYFGISISR